MYTMLMSRPYELLFWKPKPRRVIRLCNTVASDVEVVTQSAVADDRQTDTIEHFIDPNWLQIVDWNAINN